MPRKPPTPPSPRDRITLGRRTLKLGDEVKITTRVTRIGDLGSVPSITLQLPNGERFTIPAERLAAEE